MISFNKQLNTVQIIKIFLAFRTLSVSQKHGFYTFSVTFQPRLIVVKMRQKYNLLGWPYFCDGVVVISEQSRWKISYELLDSNHCIAFYSFVVFISFKHLSLYDCFSFNHICFYLSGFSIHTFSICNNVLGSKDMASFKNRMVGNTIELNRA